MRSIMRGKTTEFGQRRLDDYGLDDLSGYRDDLRLETGEPVAPGEVVAVTSGRLVKGGNTLVVALLDADMPAKQVSYDHLRQPDFFEGGYAHWIGPEGVVSVATDAIDGLRAYVRCRGMSTIIRSLVDDEKFHLSMYADTPRPVSLWDEVSATCMA